MEWLNASIYFLFLTLCSCTNLPLDDFGRVYPGMQKSEVLDVLGSPGFSQRFYGKDRWNYKFYDRGILFQKEVHFFEGTVIYAGEIYQPEVSAFQQDQINAKSDENLEQIFAKEYRAPASFYQSHSGAIINKEVQPKKAIQIFKPLTNSSK